MKTKLFFRIIARYFIIQIGVILVAVSLEMFLVPNKIIDGGVIGISIILSYLVNWQLAFFIVVLNFPFLIIAYKKLGSDFIFSTLYAVISLSIWVYIFKPVPGVTEDLFLASIFGGIIIGAGVGLIIRNGASLDGTEIISLLINKKHGFSVGEIIMFFNIFILASAGLVFGWDRAMYSLVTYFLAYKIIDIVIDGIDDAKAIFIISTESESIKNELFLNFNRGLTIFNGKGGFSDENREIIYIIIKRSEIFKLKKLVRKFDDEAFISIQDIHEVVGKNLKEWK
ncbi:MAG: YitT family protein [Ignavibacteriae bacterium]|nr:YitT family protein [Ignavibacteriota bacterium]